MTQSRWKNINSFWGYLLIDELVRNNVHCICISPGSRSTPLTVAAAENPRVNTIICPDERGAGFFALGYARAYGIPAALICTSGTAAANYFPAIIEASQSHIPMIILTADRPPELRETGANQTIDQEKLYGDYPKWYFNLPCPDLGIPPQTILTTVDQAVFRSMYPSAGPVHLNCQFREPLEPTEVAFPSGYIQPIENWQLESSPFTTYKKSSAVMGEEDLNRLVKKLNITNRGLLVVGQLMEERDKEGVIKLASTLKWPVFADILTGIRGSCSETINFFDQLLSSDKISGKVTPELILHLGRPLTSKRYLHFLNDTGLVEYIYIADCEDRLDPGHRTTERYHTDIAVFCDRVISQLKIDQSDDWYQSLKHYNTVIDNILIQQDQHDLPPSEISVARLVARGIKAGHGLFLASSMPVRDFDQFAGPFPSNSHVTSNRGASGIDGTIASALGYSKGINDAVTVVLGDLALLHDLNSLSMVKDSEYPLVVIVINNGGGGIFSFLPISNYSHVFEKFFATAHDFSFAPAAELFGLEYYRPSLNSEFEKIYTQATSGTKSSLIEIITRRDENYRLHQTIQQQIIESLEK